MDPRRLGAWTQGVVLGVFLFLALVRLLSLSSGSVLFRYQGF